LHRGKFDAHGWRRYRRRGDRARGDEGDTGIETWTDDSLHDFSFTSL
jgi:hypothetical protein